MARLAAKMLSRRQVEGLIAEGKTVFIFDGNVVRADSWLKFHPGGDISILHMVGRDATDEVNAYVSFSPPKPTPARYEELSHLGTDNGCSLHSVEARARMRSFIIGKVQQPWESFTPPLHGGKFRPYIEGEEDEELSEPECPQSREARSSSSSSISSEDNSFLLDPSLRRRRQGSVVVASSSSSMTSVSVYDETSMEELTRSGVEHDLATYPALDPETQGKIVDLYRELDKQVRAAGLYDCNYVRYMREVVRYLTYLSISLIFLHYGWYKMSAFFLGVFWHQITFTAHDAGHMGITHHFHTDTCIGIFIADFCGGLSLGWWKRSHNVKFPLSYGTCQFVGCLEIEIPRSSSLSLKHLFFLAFLCPDT